MGKNLKSAIEALKAIVFEVETAPVSEQKFYTANLVDGTEVKFLEELVVGATVIYTSDDQPLMDGEYELEDGTKFKVEGGLVSEIISKEEVIEEVENFEVEEEIVEEIVEEVVEEVKELEVIAESLEEIIENLKNEIIEKDTLIEELTLKIEEMGNKVIELSAQPAAKAIKVGASEETEKLSKSKAFFSALEKINKK